MLGLTDIQYLNTYLNRNSGQQDHDSKDDRVQEKG